jgi:hypothetical protein
VAPGPRRRIARSVPVASQPCKALTRRVIRRAFEIYRDQIGVLLPAALLVFAVDAVVSWMFDEGLLALVAAVVSLVLAILYEGIVLQLVRDVQDGGATTRWESCSAACRRSCCR